jgi:hypothetical protein
MTSPVILSRKMPTANETYQKRFECLRGIYEDMILKIEQAATSALTYTDRYKDTISGIKDFSSAKHNKGLCSFDKLEGTYKKIKRFYDLSKELYAAVDQELKFNIGQSVPVYSKEDSYLSNRKNEQDKMGEMMKDLSRINQLFAQRIIPFRDQTNNYMCIVKEGRQLSAWEAGVLSSADFYRLDDSESVAEKEKKPIKQEEERKSPEMRSYAQVADKRKTA